MRHSVRTPHHFLTMFTSVQVNHLSTALLSILLLPNLLKGAELHKSFSRAVFVSSGVHHWVTFQGPILSTRNILETLSEEEYCTQEKMHIRYPESKRKL